MLRHSSLFQVGILSFKSVCAGLLFPPYCWNTSTASSSDYLASIFPAFSKLLFLCNWLGKSIAEEQWYILETAYLLDMQHLRDKAYRANALLRNPIKECNPSCSYPSCAFLSFFPHRLPVFCLQRAYDPGWTRKPHPHCSPNRHLGVCCYWIPSAYCVLEQTR